MDRGAFYRALRARSIGVFGDSLSQRQVDGLEPLIDACEGLPLSHAAHVMAEVYHETGGDMYPVKETVFSYHEDKNPSDATVIDRLDRAYEKGQLPWVSQPYWRDGWFGRGAIQLTHRRNYVKMSRFIGADILGDPAKALDPAISAQIAVQGCKHGLFTGKSLADYDKPGGFDHYHARAIVNGDTAKNGSKVQAYAQAFEKALQEAGWSGNPQTPERDELAAARARIAKLEDQLARIGAIAEEA